MVALQKTRRLLAGAVIDARFLRSWVWGIENCCANCSRARISSPSVFLLPELSLNDALGNVRQRSLCAAVRFWNADKQGLLVTAVCTRATSEKVVSESSIDCATNHWCFARPGEVRRLLLLLLPRHNGGAN